MFGYRRKYVEGQPIRLGHVYGYELNAAFDKV